MYPGKTRPVRTYGTGFCIVVQNGAKYAVNIGQVAPMPKENTHLWFARRLIASPEARGELGIIRDEHPLFSLGSIIPDAFFYHPRSRARRMARVLHGSDPEWAGRTPSHLVQMAGRTGLPRDKAFVLGYLSHLALDKVFHPVVHVLSGKRRGQSSSGATVARHRLVETALDQITNDSCFYPRIIRPCFSDQVGVLQSLAAEVGLMPRDARQALSIQHLANRLIMRRSMHMALTLMDFLPWLDLSGLRNLCYTQLDHEPGFAVRAAKRPGEPATDTALRAVRRIKWSRLFAESHANALTMFQACCAYWRGDLPRDAIVDALPRHACD
jgi:hypothetical protein